MIHQVQRSKFFLKKPVLEGKWFGSKNLDKKFQTFNKLLDL